MTWWDSFGGDRTLHVVVARDGDEVVGIAPLMLSRVTFYGWPVRRLESIGNDHTPRFEFIVRDDEPAVYDAIWEAIRLSRRGTWDVLLLKQLPAERPTLDALRSQASEPEWHIGRWKSHDSPFVPFTDNWTDYTERLSRKHRSNLRNRFRRLERLGAIGLDIVTTEQALEASLDDGLRIEPSGWKTEAGTAIHCDPDVSKFYRELASRAAKRGMLRLMFLTVNGNRIAFAYVLEYRNKLYALKIGYDPDFAQYSPSKLLCYLVFNQAFERRVAEYEFLGARDAWKLDWTNRTRPHEWLYVFPDRIPGRWLYRAKFHLAPRLRRMRHLQHIGAAALRMLPKRASLHLRKAAGFGG